jgi:hypothetical protein
MEPEDVVAGLVGQCQRCFIEFGIIMGEIRRLPDVSECGDLRAATLRVVRTLLAEHGVVAGDFNAQERFVSWMPLKCALDRIDSLWTLLMDEAGRDVTVFFGHSGLLAK